MADEAGTATQFVRSPLASELVWICSRQPVWSAGQLKTKFVPPFIEYARLVAVMLGTAITLKVLVALRCGFTKSYGFPLVTTVVTVLVVSRLAYRRGPRDQTAAINGHARRCRSQEVGHGAGVDVRFGGGVGNREQPQ